MKNTKPFLLTLTLAVAGLSSLSGHAGNYRSIAEIVPSSFAKKVAQGSDIVGIRWIKNAGTQGVKSGEAGLSSLTNVVQGLYVSGTTAVNFATRVGFGSDAIADLQSKRVGLWITGPKASQNLFTGLAATAEHGGMAVYKSAEFATRATASVLSATVAASTQIFKASMYAADAVAQLGKEYVLKPTHDLFHCLYRFTKNLAVRTANGVAAVGQGALSKPLSMLGGALNGLVPNLGNGLENAGSKLWKSAGKSGRRAVK